MKKLVCIGGGNVPRYMKGVLLPYETKEIDEEIVRLSNKNNPKFLFISLASAHPDEYYEGIYKVYNGLGCIVSHLDPNKSYSEIEEEILSSDIIYVGAGDTNRLFKELKDRKIDRILKEAYNRGIVCAGISAGSYCWFKYTYKLLEGMDIVHAVNCVHYDEKDDSSKQVFYNVIKINNLVGYAIDNYVAIEFIDDDIKVIKSDNSKNAYKVIYDGNNFIEEIRR